MGRELKRVKLDFKWDIKEIWEGYINPYYKYSQICQSCNGTGYSKEYEVLKNKWYGYSEFNPSKNNSVPFSPNDPDILEYVKRKIHYSDSYKFYSKNGVLSEKETIQLEAARLCSECWNNHWSHHLNDEEVKWLWNEGRLREFKKCPNATTLNKSYLFGMGHDSINNWIIIENTLKKENKPAQCSLCKGNGSIWKNKEYKKLCEEWDPIEPPVGDGFQLWETTIEGYPISPVFVIFSNLCKWCEDNATTFGSEVTTKENWAKMLDTGFVYHKSNNSIFC